MVDSGLPPQKTFGSVRIVHFVDIPCGLAIAVVAIAVGYISSPPQWFKLFTCVSVWKLCSLEKERPSNNMSSSFWLAQRARRSRKASTG